MKRIVGISLLLLLAACGSKPRQPDWLVNADGEQERFERAYLQGNEAAAGAEFTRLRSDVAGTAQPGLVARAELTRCAVRIASLDFTPCSGFEPLRRDAGDAERAYADFLAGAPLDPAQVQLLPKDYRAIAGGRGGAAAVRDIQNPLSQLVASAVLLRAGRADPEVLEIAAGTASRQGWRRAVLAWLGAQAMRAQQAGDVETARSLRRRMDLAAPAGR